jgi:arabinan endo-1,5-alpha-L-arabinosidase
LRLETHGAFVGPGHPGIIKEGERFWMSMHFYDGTQGVMSMLAIRPLVWGEKGWPVVMENK